VSTNFDILDKAEKLELLSAEIYGALARRFGDDEAAVKLFTRLCAEEEQHAARVRLVAAQSRRDSKLLGKITVDGHELDDVVRELTTMLANLRAGNWDADLAQTKRLLLDLEERSEQAHAHAINGLHESLRRFFEQLALQDKAHEELLRR
jgi:multidrug resistance efflux pump